MNTRRRSLTAAAVLSALGGVVLGAPVVHSDTPVTLYVDSGNSHCGDGNSGLSATAPLCTVHAAMASPILVPGGTVVINGADGAMDITRSGTPGSPITIIGGGYGSWFTVTGQHDVEIDGANDLPPVAGPSSGDVIHVVNSQRIVMHRDGGRCCLVGAIHLTGTSDSVVDGSPGGFDSHQQVIIDGGSTRDVVENLVADQQSDASEVTITDSPNNSVVNNTIVASMLAPVVVTGVSTGTVVENNIFYGTGDSADQPASVPAVSVDASATSGTRIGYNIFDSAGLGGPAVSWAGTAYPTGTAFDASAAGTVGHDRDVDPKLPPRRGTYPDDLHLTPASPAVDAGDASVAPPRDNEGRARIDDPAVADTGSGSPTYADIGAYEYTADPFAVNVWGQLGPSPSNYQTVTVDAKISGGWWPASPVSVSFSIDGTPVRQLTEPADGSFTISLPDGEHALSATAVDAGGTKATSSSLLLVHPAVFTPQLTVTASPGDNGEVVIGIGGVSATKSFTLDMGDGRPPITGVGLTDPNNGINWNGLYQYQKSGTYHVKLTATDPNGWPGSASADVSVSVKVPPRPEQPVVTVHRVAGPDRYTTAIAASHAQWADGSAGAVVLANGAGFPDALAGVPLAAHVHGPLLLTDPHSLGAATAAEIGRVLGSGGKTVYVLGGTSAVSEAVLAQLPPAVHVQRIGGSDRFDTARRIAAVIGSAQSIVVANGMTFPDALTAGPLAAKQNTAIVLSDGPVLDPKTAALVSQHRSVIAVGGPAAAAVRANVNLTGLSFTDLHGQDRYATSHLVFDAIGASRSPASFGVASGVTFPDALTGGAYMANAGKPLVLADPALAGRDPWLPSVLRDETNAVYSEGGSILVFGGPKAVDDRIVNDLALWTNGRVQ